jgi:hypothetical protein
MMQEMHKDFCKDVYHFIAYNSNEIWNTYMFNNRGPIK